MCVWVLMCVCVWDWCVCLCFWSQRSENPGTYLWTRTMVLKNNYVFLPGSHQGCSGSVSAWLPLSPSINRQVKRALISEVRNCQPLNLGEALSRNNYTLCLSSKQPTLGVFWTPDNFQSWAGLGWTGAMQLKVTRPILLYGTLLSTKWSSLSVIVYLTAVRKSTLLWMVSLNPCGVNSLREYFVGPQAT